MVRGMEDGKGDGGREGVQREGRGMEGENGMEGEKGDGGREAGGREGWKEDRGTE